MATLLCAEFVPAPKVKPRRGLNGWIALCALVSLIFLAFPVVASDSSSSQSAVPSLPEQPLDWLTQLAPYGIVMLLGAIVGLAEISSTFPNYPREALRTRWARLLILINALAAMLAFWIARTYASNTNLALLANGIAAYTITARATLSQEEQKARLETLDKLLDPKVPVDLARASIALRILENGGQAYVELLLHHPAASVPGAVTPENLVKQMVDRYSLTELVALTKRLTNAPELQNWVEQAAQPTPDAPEASQKIAIVQRLLKEAGVEAVRQEMEKHS